MIRTGEGSLSGFDGLKEQLDLKKLTVIFIGCFLLSGCSKVKHVDQLLTLKGLADEQARIGAYVQEQDQNFERMLAEVKAGTLDEYLNKKEIRHAFGDPVFTRQEMTEGKEFEVWLYRYATQYFGSKKVYLYFDADGELVRSEYIEGETDGEIEQETPAEDGRQEF